MKKKGKKEEKKKGYYIGVLGKEEIVGSKKI
jgi:hypothetical protein